jgi:hypothetical protein
VWDSKLGKFRLIRWPPGEPGIGRITGGPRPNDPDLVVIATVHTHPFTRLEGHISDRSSEGDQIAADREQLPAFILYSDPNKPGQINDPTRVGGITIIFYSPGPTGHIGTDHNWGEFKRECLQQVPKK